VLPPLRERPEDIPLLAQHFLEHFMQKNTKTLKGFTPQAMDQLIKYKWPGNVRELMNAIERGVVLARSEYLDVDALPLVPAVVSDRREASSAVTTVEGMALEDLEKQAILNTLAATGGNKSAAARQLGITRKTLRKKLEQYKAHDELT
jgi:two-component system response regulator HydG